MCDSSGDGGAGNGEGTNGQSVGSIGMGIGPDGGSIGMSTAEAAAVGNAAAASGSVSGGATSAGDEGVDGGMGVGGLGMGTGGLSVGGIGGPGQDPDASIGPANSPQTEDTQAAAIGQMTVNELGLNPAVAPMGLLGIAMNPSLALAHMQNNPIGFTAANIGLIGLGLANPALGLVGTIGSIMNALGATPSTDGSVADSGSNGDGYNGVFAPTPGLSEWSGGGVDNDDDDVSTPGSGSNNGQGLDDRLGGVGYISWNRGPEGNRNTWDYGSYNPAADRRSNVAGGFGNRLLLV